MQAIIRGSSAAIDWVKSKCIWMKERITGGGSSSDNQTENNPMMHEPLLTA